MIDLISILIFLFAIITYLGIAYIYPKLRSILRIPQGKTVVGLRSDLLTQVRKDYEIHKVTKVGADSHKVLIYLAKECKRLNVEMPDVYIVHYKGKLSFRRLTNQVIYFSKKGAIEHIMEKVRYRYNDSGRLGRKRTIKQKTEKVWFYPDYPGIDRDRNMYSIEPKAYTPPKEEEEDILIKEYINGDQEYLFVELSEADDFEGSMLHMELQETGRVLKASTTYVIGLVGHGNRCTYSNQKLKGDSVRNYMYGRHAYILLED